MDGGSGSACTCINTSGLRVIVAAAAADAIGVEEMRLLLLFLVGLRRGGGGGGGGGRDGRMGRRLHPSIRVLWWWWFLVERWKRHVCMGKGSKGQNNNNEWIYPKTIKTINLKDP